VLLVEIKGKVERVMGILGIIGMMGVDGLEEVAGLYCNMSICIYDHYYNEFSARTVSFYSPEKSDDDHVSSILVLCRLSGFALLLLW